MVQELRHGDVVAESFGTGLVGVEIVGAEVDVAGVEGVLGTGAVGAGMVVVGQEVYMVLEVEGYVVAGQEVSVGRSLGVLRQVDHLGSKEVGKTRNLEML